MDLLYLIIAAHKDHTKEVTKTDTCIILICSCLIKYMKYIALTLPGFPNDIQPPGGVPSGNGAVQTFINGFIDLILIVVSIASLFYLIYGAFKWMTSGGDQEKLAAARMAIIYSILGLVVSFLSFLIIKVIGQFLGVDLLQLSY